MNGSPEWQAGLFVLAALYLVWEGWSGWRAGLARAAMRLAAVVLSAMMGWQAGVIAASPFGGFSTPGGLVVGVVFGLIVAVVVFVLFAVLSMVLFKRTAQQPSWILRLFWGLGGMLLGVTLGVFVLWGGISVVRTFGAIAESEVSTGASRTNQDSLTSEPSQVAQVMAKAKASLELGEPGRLLVSADLFPSDFYQILSDIARLQSSPDAMARFLEYPQIKEITRNSKLAELLNDPAVLEQCEKRDIVALMANKKLVRAVEDPELGALLRKIDFRDALKFALAKPGPDPSPSPTNRRPSEAAPR